MPQSHIPDNRPTLVTCVSPVDSVSRWPGGLDRVGISLKKNSSSEEAIIVGLKSELICVKYATIFYYMQ
jgi:hypothetical protein